MTKVFNNSFETVAGLGSEFGVQYDTDEELAAVYLFRGYPESLLCFATACLVIFMLIGIPGNLATIVALARCKKVRNATAIFIINLHISDFIFCCMILPMSAMTFAQRRWTHGVIMCRVFPFFKYVLNASSIFTILAISINRYVMVCHPLLYPRMYKRRNISITLIVIWTSSIAIFLGSTFGAWGRLDLDLNGGLCTMLKDKYNRSPKIFFIYVAFVGPYLSMFFCYARIWWVVRKTAKKTMIQPARLTHLPLSHTKSDTSSDGSRLMSFELSISGNSTPGDDSKDKNSAATTPKEEGTLEKYFKAPFRLTRRINKPKTPTRRDKKLRAMIAAIMLSFCVCHLPIMVTRMVYREYKSKPLPNVFAHLLEYSGTCMNPIIYVLMSNEYRHAYKSLFDSITKKFQRQ